MSQTRIFYSANTLFIDGIRLPIPAGSLHASLMADNATISIMKNGSTDPLVFRTFKDILDINGAGFSNAHDCMTYLAGQFVMRRPIADQVGSQLQILTQGQTQLNLQTPPLYFVTVRLLVNGVEYRPPSISVSSTTITWLRDDFILEPADEVIAVYA